MCPLWHPCKLSVGDCRPITCHFWEFMTNLITRNSFPMMPAACWFWVMHVQPASKRRAHRESGKVVIAGLQGWKGELHGWCWFMGSEYSQHIFGNIRKKLLRDTRLCYLNNRNCVGDGDRCFICRALSEQWKGEVRLVRPVFFYRKPQGPLDHLGWLFKKYLEQAR